MRILLVRHYRTVNNETRLIMGWGDAPPADDWETDVAYVDAVLAERDIRFDAYYSSALPRAVETARYLAGKRGCSLVHAAVELNEVNYGSLFQKSKEWVEEHYPQYKTNPDFVFPQGESFRQMQQRSVELVLSLQSVHPHDTVLIVAHAGVIRGLISHFLGLDLEANLKRKVSHRYVGELILEQGACVRYDELGRPSGFVKEAVVQVPSCPSQTAACASSRSSAEGTALRQPGETMDGLSLLPHGC